MTLMLLAPVTAVHLESALEFVGQFPGTVAFGSNAREVFNGMDPSVGANVLLFATATGGTEHEIYRKGVPWKTVACGRFSHWEPANQQGRSSSGRRPPSTETGETPCLGFWHVDGLRELLPRYRHRIGGFKAKGGQELTGPLHGPTLVEEPHDLALG